MYRQQLLACSTTKQGSQHTSEHSKISAQPVTTSCFEASVLVKTFLLFIPHFTVSVSLSGSHMDTLLVTNTHT